jgi:hypothetical protein
MGEIHAKEDNQEVIKKLRKWEKFAEFPSMLPNKLAWKFDSDS